MLEQVLIMLLSAAAIYLVNAKGGAWVKWGCLSGFVAQPFWFHVGWHTAQLALMPMSAFYAYSYARGIWREWRLAEVMLGRRG